MKASENEKVAEVLAEFGKNIELMRKCRCVEVSLWNCLKFKLRIEAAYRREVAELRECLIRRSSHLNAILQKALELRNDVPSELRKVMDECIVAEDKAIGFGAFSKKGAEDEDK